MKLRNIFFFTLASVFTIYAGWSPAPFDLSVDGYNASNAQVAVDSAGNAVAVWGRYDGSYNRIQARKYDVGTGDWSDVVNLSTDGQDARIDSGRVGLNSNGDAVVIWTRPNGGMPNIFVVQAAKSDFGSNAWSTPVDLSSGTSVIEDYPPDLAVDPAGNCTAVWAQPNGNPDDAIFASRAAYTPFLWSAPTEISPIPSGNKDSREPLVSVDSNGKVAAIWINNRSGANESVQANIYDGSWGTAENISIPSPTLVFNLSLDMGPTGIAAAAWRYIASPRVLKAAVYDGSDWLPEQTVSTGSENVSSPSVVVDSSGNPFVIWPQPNPGYHDLFISSYTGLLWSTPTAIFSLPGNSLVQAKIATGSEGSAIVVWTALSFSKTIYTSSLKDGTWSTPIALSSLLTLGDAEPEISMNLSGNAVAVWEGDDTFNTIIQTSIFSLPAPPAPPAPTNFFGKVVNNKFLMQTDIVHVLSWTAAEDPAIVGYRVYESGNLIEQVPASGPLEVFVHNRKKGKTYIYSLVSFDESGNESDPIFLQLP